MDNIKPLILIFLGKSGSGKGTQLDKLRERMGFDFIGSGELLRARKQEHDFTGRKIASVIDNGGLIETPVIFSLWMSEFERLKNKESELKGIVIDGSPRKIREAYLMDEALNWYEWNDNFKAILIDVLDEEVLSRIADRRICNQCSEIVPYVGDLKKLTNCPKCNGELIRRPEDSDQESVKKRLEWFTREVSPVIEFYKERNKLITIDGNQTVEKVFEDILESIQAK
ncbi:MAG: nucleoside monophosphate kinase [Candidatus Pacebacteria bacterium]|nr:nucleoside monophosphate kinase [Candidatus Paceibacterota bacterium]